MNKLFSLFVLSAALCATAGCGNKKNIKATPKAPVAHDVIVETSTAKDTKEDYTIAA